MVLKFFDLSTLADRLKNDDTTAIEYKAKDGNWHLARFIVKIRNEEGRAIHVLYVTRNNQRNKTQRRKPCTNGRTCKKRKRSKN